MFIPISVFISTANAPFPIGNQHAKVQVRKEGACIDPACFSSGGDNWLPPVVMYFHCVCVPLLCMCLCILTLHKVSLIQSRDSFQPIDSILPKSMQNLNIDFKVIIKRGN